MSQQKSESKYGFVLSHRDFAKSGCGGNSLPLADASGEIELTRSRS